MACSRKGLVVVAVLINALGLGAATATAMEATATAQGDSKAYKHTLKGALGKFSWQLKKRPVYQHVLWYLPSRVADLLDCVGVEIGGGLGIHANVHATRLLQLGIGREMSSRVGLMSRYPVVVDQELDEKAIGWWWRMDLRRETLLGQAPDVELGEDEVARTYNKAVDPAAIGVAAFPGAFGVSAEVKLHEVLDFVKGIFLIDSLEDDY
jgi:hypothetical protein